MHNHTPVKPHTWKKREEAKATIWGRQKTTEIAQRRFFLSGELLFTIFRSIEIRHETNVVSITCGIVDCGVYCYNWFRLFCLTVYRLPEKIHFRFYCTRGGLLLGEDRHIDVVELLNTLLVWYYTVRYRQCLYAHYKRAHVYVYNMLNASAQSYV